MLFKKDKPEVAEATDRRFDMVFSAQAGNALLKIIRTELTDFEKQKYDIINRMEHLPLVSEKAQKYHDDLLTIRNKAIDVDELRIAIEKFARKDNELGAGFLVTTMHPTALGNLITVVNNYKQKRMSDLMKIRDGQLLGNDSFEETAKFIEDLNKSLQYVAMSEEVINAHSSQL